MKKEWILWAAAMIVGISLSASGCGEKKSSDGDTEQSRVEAAPSSPKDRPEPGSALAPSGGSDQNSSQQKQNTGGDRKSQPG
jgi:hypothetical protein